MTGKGEMIFIQAWRASRTSGNRSYIARLAGIVGHGFCIYARIPAFLVEGNMRAKAMIVSLLGLVLFQSCSNQHHEVSVYRGLNLFGPWENSVSSQAWAFPTAAELDYYKAKRLTTFRVPLLWENLQPRLFGPFDPKYLAAMDKLVMDCKARGERVSFTFINHALYPANSGYAIGSPEVPAAAFYDLWTKLADHYEAEPAVWAYDLMNEPFHDSQWQVHAQGAINAIRQVDSVKPIIAMPQHESAAQWDVTFPGFHDPANHLWYEAHIYFDRGSNGFYRGTYDEEGAYPQVGVDRATAFVDWCTSHHARCTMGEYGIPGGPTGGQATYDTRWLTVLDNFLKYLDANGISGNYWSAGPYGDINSVEPVYGRDRPQMSVLESHLSR